MTGTAGVDDVQFLMDIACKDSEAPCRHESLRALVALPLNSSAAKAVLDVGRCAGVHLGIDALARLEAMAAAQSPAPLRPTVRRADGLAADVRNRILGNDGLPQDLSGLATLPTDDAAALLTDVLARLLGSVSEPVDVLRLGTGRLADVVRSLDADGTRAIAAWLPPLTFAIPRDRRPWTSSLLALVGVSEILRAIRQALARSDNRLSILELLATSAPRLATSPAELADADSVNGDELLRLLELVAEQLQPEASADGFESYVEPQTRTAYARLEAPDRIAPAEAFELRVGLAESPGRGVTPSPLTVPGDAFVLDVKIAADGFEVLGGGSLTATIAVTPADPFAYDVIRLRAIRDPALSATRTIIGSYFIRGQWLGVASRQVCVSDDPDIETPVTPTQPKINVDWVLPADAGSRPDLEILVTPGNDAGGPRRFLWYFRSPHPTVGEGGFFELDLPDSVGPTVRQLISGIEDRADDEDLSTFLRGVGRRIADAVPTEIWDALSAAAAARCGPPSVLLATADPFIPWELARIPEPWSKDGPPILGAQTTIGRWPYLANGRSPAPPTLLELRQLAVISGEYAEGERLEQAEQEAAQLRAYYSAYDIPAKLREVVRCLDGEPDSQAVHLAVHGNFDPTGKKDGIYLVDGEFLNPVSVEGIEKSPLRLAFLNACQLGQGREIFGVYAGMGFALLRIGVGAVVAPLWKVDDVVAREVAESFYPAVFSDEEPVSPAAFLRTERCSAGGAETAGGTRLAYVFYGHPLLRVKWTGSVG